MMQEAWDTYDICSSSFPFRFQALVMHLSLWDIALDGISSTGKSKKKKKKK